MSIIPPLPFRKFAVIGDELRVGVLCHTEDDVRQALQHPDLLLDACGDDAALYETAERDLYVTGWLQGGGSHLTVSSYPVDVGPDDAVQLKRSALELIQGWATDKDFDVSPKVSWLES